MPSVSHNIFLSEYMWMTLTFRFTRSHNSTCILLPIGVPLEPSLYLQPLSRYLYPNVSGSWPWPFTFTWRHRSRDHLIPRLPFPIGALL